jgi:signal peptidase I
MEKYRKKCPRCNAIQDANNKECSKCQNSLSGVAFYKPKRKAIVAFFLSLIITGLGQAYNGQLIKGIILYIIFGAITTTSLILGSFHSFKGMIISLVIFVVLRLTISFEALYSAIKLKYIFPKSYNKWYIYLGFFLLVSFIVSPLSKAIIKNSIVRAYKIPSDAMKPTLLVGDYINVDMNYMKPQREDIIVFVYPVDEKKDFIKRVIGLPRETIEIRDANIYINGTLYNDKFGYYLDQWGNRINPSVKERYGPKVIPENHLFVMGDNRNHSYDSRFWGFVPLELVKGKALYIYWAKNLDRIGMDIK